MFRGTASPTGRAVRLWSFGAVVLALAAATLPPSGVMTRLASAGSAVKAVPATADAMVSATQADQNFGKQSFLRTDGSPVYRTYLRFNVSGLGDLVANASLRVHVRSSKARNVKVRLVRRNNWRERGITYENAPKPGKRIGTLPQAGKGDWASIDVTSVVGGGGRISFMLVTAGGGATRFSSREGGRPPKLVIEVGQGTLIAAAGDIACQPHQPATSTTCHQKATSDLVLSRHPVAVLTLGDHQYEDGTLAEFLGPGAYDETWGRFKNVTHPVPGNHEYHVSGAPGYFSYFGPAAGPPGDGYYSFDIGNWHIVALNYYVSISSGSAQIEWLTNDLAADTRPCTLAYMHRPRYSSGGHGSDTGPEAAWEALYADGAELMLVGHDHHYERFAPMDPFGSATPNGIREFVVGSGGASHSGWGTIEPNSEFRDNQNFGVLFLRLLPSSYEWRFLSEDGQVIDSGSGDCG